MARRRMIHPEIWQSENFSQLSILARLIFIGLFSIADDEGRGRCRPIYIKSTLFPYDENLRVADIEKALSEIGTKMSVTFYSHNENNYYCLDNWKKWQRVDKPRPSVIPSPESVENHSGISRESFQNHSGIIPESFSPKRKEEKRKENNIIHTCASASVGVDEMFESFWREYPKKKAKETALKAFKRLKPTPDLLKVMLDALQFQKASADWLKDGGQYIPYPATWLNQRRWEDEVSGNTMTYTEVDGCPY